MMNNNTPFVFGSDNNNNCKKETRKLRNERKGRNKLDTITKEFEFLKLQTFQKSFS